ncbi:hypothetical protein ACB092_06G038000 [Castanea dentata]
MVFNVMDDGAIADGNTDNRIHMLRPIVLKGPCKGPVEFQIIGTLKAFTDEASTINVNHWITFQYIDQLILRGGGKLDGQGCIVSHFCNIFFSPLYLDHSLIFDFVTNSRVTHITSINSKNAHVNVFACKDVKFDHIHIAPKDSPNTDGIHIGSSSNIQILDLTIATGDDCVSMSPGSKNINIKNVKCGPGHGISVGSLGGGPNEEDVSGLMVTNCTFKGTDNGLRVKTWARSYASNVFNLTFEDIIMDNVNNPIIIDQQYCPSRKCEKGDSQVQIRNVNYRNIRGTSSSKITVAFECSKGKPCDKIELNNINLTYHGAEGAVASSCSNAKGIANGQQQPDSCMKHSFLPFLKSRHIQV